MDYTLQQTAPPAAEPLTRVEMKAYLRVDHDADDGLIDSLIAAARDACERETGRSLITQSYLLKLRAAPPAGRIPLPRPPLQSASVTGLTPNDDYIVNVAGDCIDLFDPADNLEIAFTAGYGDDPEDLPPLLRQGLRQLVARLYEHRGDADALSSSGALALFRPFRVMGLA